MRIKLHREELKTSVYTDEELVSLFLRTQEKYYFGLLYRRRVGTVYKQCLAFVKDPDEAQDITQDIFLKLMSRLKSFRGECKFATWLYSVTFNHCVEDFRISKRKREIMMNWSIQVWEDIDLNSTLEVDPPKTENLNKALAQLRTQEQLILLMKYDEGLSIPDMAKRLMIKESAVKMRLMRIRSKIKKKYLRMYQGDHITAEGIFEHV